MNDSEFSRPVQARHVPAAPLTLEASEAECAALTRRFGIVAVTLLRAEVSLSPDDDAVVANGRLVADLVQTCGVSGDEFPVHVEEPLALRFVAQRGQAPEGEIELDPGDCDEIEYQGDSFDLGEAVAQSLGLAIDPYARGPEAETARRKAGITGDDTPRGPLAEALAALKKD